MATNIDIKQTEKKMQGFSTSLVNLLISLKQGQITQQVYDAEFQKIQQEMDVFSQTPEYREWHGSYDGFAEAERKILGREIK